jgi:hypothetical protein
VGHSAKRPGDFQLAGEKGVAHDKKYYLPKLRVLRFPSVSSVRCLLFDLLGRLDRTTELLDRLEAAEVRNVGRRAVPAVGGEPERNRLP